MDGFAGPQLAHPHALEQVGRTIGGNFTVSSLVGVGGMGSVYLATEVTTGDVVAVKVLNPTSLCTTNVRRFRREAWAAIAVPHEHVCRVRGFGIECGIPFIVMERLAGETLRARLLANGPLDVADAVTVMLQLLEGLAAAHEAGILHRDVKPSNVFVVTPRGSSPVIKLIDFGLAKAFGSSAGHVRTAFVELDEATQITATGSVPGSPPYIAPEQILAMPDLDQRVDVWAAGVTLFEMLTNRRAFNGGHPPALMRSILFDEAPDVSSFRPDVPPGLDRVMRTALSKRREDRYPTAREFRAALVDVWSRHRALGIVRGQSEQRSRRISAALPRIDEVDDSTDTAVIEEIVV